VFALAVSDSATNGLELEMSSSVDSGIHTKEWDLSYTNLFNDVRGAIDYVHQKGSLKAKTLEDIERYGAFA